MELGLTTVKLRTTPNLYTKEWLTEPSSSELNFLLKVAYSNARHCIYIPPNSVISTSSPLITVALDVLPIMNIIFIDFVGSEASDPIDPISFNLMNSIVVF